ncbi:MAG: acyl-CoA dehydrogenase family protein [Chloroflexi bacterium]|nr:acyl-CoA dehydrogenase family protein [Chloroflexota bacterium]
MDFEIVYTKGQQAFRKEVRDWLDKNIPQIGELPVDGQHITPEQDKAARAFRGKLGEKGWLFPTVPVEYGGKGLTWEHAVVIDEELSERAEEIPHVPDNSSLAIPPLLIYGTEEQKRRLIPPMARGQVTTWQGFTEAEAGSDLAALRTTAIRQGDSYVINGHKLWQGGPYPAENWYLICVTNPDAPRHHNLSAFVLPTNLPGISMIPQQLFVYNRHQVFLDNVKVPVENRIGEEGMGWQCVQATLELEHGGSGRIGLPKVMDHFLSYLREAKKAGRILDALERDRVVDMYINAHVERLFGLRNYWQRATKQWGTYEGSQLSLWGKVQGLNRSKTVLDVVGPDALVNEEDSAAKVRGWLEEHQRQSVLTHPGATIEIQKVIMARRIAMSATQERAAVTV